MYAIIDVGGSQLKVEKGKYYFINRREEEEGQAITFDKVLLIDNDGEVKIGKPHVEGAKIEAKVVEHLKGDKVIVFKKKRRKGYKVRNGHRQYLTKVEVENIAL
jgi:large subunit ribosomal protein L21